MTTETARRGFTRIVRTDDGGSKFEDDEFSLVSQRVAEGMPDMAVGGMPSASGVSFLRGEAFDSDPHPAPRTQWVVMLRGTIEVRVSDGTARRFGPGDLVLAADTSGAGHVTTGVGDPPFEGLFIPVP